MADRFIEVSLAKRGVSCTAKLLDDRAPVTCEAVWNALPLGGDVYHAKYARNEIYALVAAVRPQEPPPGEPDNHPHPRATSCYFSFTAPSWHRSYGYRAASARHRGSSRSSTWRSSTSATTC